MNRRSSSIQPALALVATVILTASACSGQPSGSVQPTPRNTFNPATFLRCLGPEPWKAAYVEPSLRPSDGRYGENPFRFQQFLQYQVVIKPAPPDVLDLYFASL